MLFPALSKSLISIVLVGDHLCDDRSALNLSVSFPLYFSLIVSSASPAANPSQPTALPSTQERGRKVAQQLIPVPLLLWSISRDAVRAGQQCKHQPLFSFPLPALQPHSPSQLHIDLPLPTPPSSLPSSRRRAPSSASLPQGFSVNQQQSPLVQGKYDLFLAVNILWRIYAYPKKTPYLSFRPIVAPLTITRLPFWVQTAVTMLPRVCLCVCACLCLLDHIYGEQFENNRRREQTHRAEQ